MFLSCVLSLVLTAAEPNNTWNASSEKAMDLAIKEKKDLVIYFRARGELDDVLGHADVVNKLKNFVCLKIPTDYKVADKRLLDYPVLSDMLGKPGLAVVSCHDKKLPTFATVISVHPVTASRYRWVPAYGVEQVKFTLELPPAATLSQRSMIYAVRVHPEVPQSV